MKKIIILLFIYSIINAHSLRIVPISHSRLPLVELNDTLQFAVVTELDDSGYNGVGFYLKVPEQDFQIIMENGKPFRENNYFSGGTVFSNQKIQNGLYGFSEASLNGNKTAGTDTVCYFKGVVISRNQISLALDFSTNSPYVCALSKQSGETVSFSKEENYTVFFTPKKLQSFQVSDFPADTGGQLFIRWSLPNETPGFIKGVRLYKEIEGAYLLIKETTHSTSLTYTDSNAAPEGSKYYAVTYHEFGESASSDTLFAVPVDNRPSSFQSLTPLPDYQLKNQYPSEGMFFNWTKSNDPDGHSMEYYISFALDSLFYNTILKDTIFSDTSCGIHAPYLENQPLYWKVQGKDQDGFFRQTETKKFYINVIPESPSPIKLIAPVKLKQIEDLYPKFQWTSSTDADPLDTPLYELQLSDNQNFSSDIINITLQDTIYEYTKELAPDHIYYWRITATDSSRPYTSETANFQYIHKNQPPTEFNLISPIDSFSLADEENILFQWERSTPESPYDSITYEIQISTDSLYFSHFKTIVKDTFYLSPTESFMENSVYFWKVVAKDSEGRQRESSQIYFFYKNTINDPPLSFNLSFPYSGAVISGEDIPFTWNRARDDDPFSSIRYDWLLYNENMERIDSIRLTNDTIYHYQKSLTENELYFWSVIAMDEQNATAYSYPDYNSFQINKIEESPSSFSLISPASDSVLKNEAVSFIWEKAMDNDPYDSVAYRIQFSENSDFSSFRDTLISDTLATLSPDFFKTDTTYYWRVKAIDQTNNETLSRETYLFSIDTKPPEIEYTLLQETLFPNYLKIFIQASEPLKTPPEISFNGTTLASETTDSDSRVYFASTRLPLLSNPYQLEITATDLTDNQKEIDELISIFTGKKAMKKISGLPLHMANQSGKHFYLSRPNDENSDIFRVFPLKEDVGLDLILTTEHTIMKNSIALTPSKTKGPLNYYSIHIKGEYTLSRLNCTKNEETLTAYPNPWRDELHIKIQAQGRDYTLRLFNTIGKEVKTFFKNKGIDNQLEFIYHPTNPSLASGVYFLVLYENNRIKSLRKTVLIK